MEKKTSTNSNDQLILTQGSATILPSEQRNMTLTPISKSASSQLINPLRICPVCFKPLKTRLVCTPYPWIYSLILLLSLMCWLPFVVDACKRREIYCEGCGKVIKVYREGPEECC